MSHCYLVRVGLLGAVGRFRTPGVSEFSRDDQVVCRTDRGLETGVVLCCLRDQTDAEAVDGELLRVMGREDHLIAERLERFRDRAFLACQSKLRERNIVASLLDVEQTFDGGSIWFYFLGDVGSEVEQLTDELAEAYEAKVKFRKFAETLANGCGPDCGTGASCGDCSSCALKGCGAKS